MFRDRTDAGRQLAEAMADRGVSPELVLAIPRGGLPPGRAVADHFDAPLGVVVAKKLGAPNNPELALAAVAEDGSVWRNDELLARLDVTDEYVDAERVRVGDEARETAERYRDGAFPSLRDRRVAIVDDGIATGATMRACLARVRAAEPASIAVGVPVGPADTIDDLGASADTVVCVETPAAFRAFGAYYRNFGQVSDEEAMGYLASE
ncbi:MULTISPECIES: phosphoribosyltransferase [Halomicrobium]|uniref:Phosphoribosyltransferase n=2 Tax=Halomicrobium mukohataei TaxID=57705 RepID=C7P2F4_HALMD|nr:MULTISPECIES: phosphoribosyltransferase family protein [Halomicrobium]ACV49269.1 phosphoribosyltransferase [Halomicrobium mukohataei DSM 12286]QCD64670.1 phosphoribosyltransferase [Halomicrobium mukohataei]QFR19477.1 phosphoribosyltransferase [Halomicrobium sp. ZPS1]